MVICFYCTGKVGDKDFVSVELYNHRFRVRKPFCNFWCLLFWMKDVSDKDKGSMDFDNEFLVFGNDKNV